MNIGDYINSLFDYYEYLRPYGDSQNMDKIGNRLVVAFNNNFKLLAKNDTDRVVDSLLDTQNDLHLEYMYVVNQVDSDVMSYAQFKRDKALNTVIP